MSILLFIVVALMSGFFVGALLGSTSYLRDAIIAVIGAFIANMVLKAFGVEFDFQFGYLLFPAIGAAVSVGLVRAI
jgi:uncharacterized membrane protein YeaQ/YmgE (transglycosylase-associated protein family)